MKRETEIAPEISRKGRGATHRSLGDVQHIHFEAKENCTQWDITGWNKRKTKKLMAPCSICFQGPNVSITKGLESSTIIIYYTRSCRRPSHFHAQIARGDLSPWAISILLVTKHKFRFYLAMRDVLANSNELTALWSMHVRNLLSTNDNNPSISAYLDPF